MTVSSDQQDSTLENSSNTESKSGETQQMDKPKRGGSPESPHWSSTTKLIVGLTVMAIIAGLLIRFRNLIGPILIAFIVAYLIHPIATWIIRKIKISWRFSINILYLIILLALLGLLTWGGFTLVGQAQSLVSFIQRQVENLPIWLEQITSKPFQILGVFTIDLQQYDFSTLAEQALGLVQPILTKLGTVLGNLAGGAASTIGYTFFALLISYFVSSETGGARARLLNLKIPGHNEDLKIINSQLNLIWNAFLRGQIIIVLIAATTYSVLLGFLGVNFYIGLAILAGLGRLIPYVGAWVTWITIGLVCFFQASTIFGVSPIIYVIIVLGISLVVDFFLDNFLTPRVMADALAVHPAAVMVAALISAQLFGLIGVLLAAPVLATLQLVGRYIVRKLFDQDPWHDLKTVPSRKPIPKYLVATGRMLYKFWRGLCLRWEKFYAWLKLLWNKLKSGIQLK